jgi:hypothetical protein
MVIGSISLKYGLQRVFANSQDYLYLMAWISSNENELTKPAKTYAEYTLSKSIKDYEDATGINREFLMQRAPLGSSKVSTAELDEHVMKMQRYANYASSNNPKSYA